MNKADLSIRHITFAAALALSVLIAVLVPAAYFVISYQYMRGVIDAQNELSATTVTDLVSANPALWRFEEIRLGELLERHLGQEDNVKRVITDAKGEIVAQNNVALPPPYVSGSHNIYDAGSVVARITSSRSLLPLLQKTLIVAACSAAFASLVFYLLRTFPLQTIRKAHLALAESEEQYRLLFEHSRDAIIVTSPDGTVTSVNPEACSLFGTTREEFLHTGRERIMDPADEGVRAALDIKAHTGQFSGELDFTKKDGSIFTGDVSLSRFTDSAGHVWSITRIRDITQRKQAEEFLLQAKKASEAACVAKSQFLANMSHEIRTPMNGILGVTQLLQYTELDEEQRELAGLIKESGDILLHLINNVLDLSKIEAHKIELETVDFDLQATVAGTIDLLSVEAREKGLELVSQIDPGVPLLLRGDPGRLRQIITNLVGNAIKFTQNGFVDLRVLTEAEDRRKATLKFQVLDSGIGIPADRLDYIFEPFTQVDSSTTRKFGGTGLGLALSRQFAEMMGGTIGVESTEGKGSTFWFTAIFEKPA